MVKRLAVDLDETIMHLLPHFLADYNTTHGTNFSTKDFHCYEWYQILGIPNDDVYARYHQWTDEKVAGYKDGPFYREYVDGAVEVLSYLNTDHELYMVSDRLPNVDHETKLICSRLSSTVTGTPLFPQERVLLTPELQLNKAELCVKHDIPAIVDDSARVAQRCLDKEIKVYMMRHPWNEGFIAQNDKHPLLVPIDSWHDLLSKYSD